MARRRQARSATTGRFVVRGRRRRTLGGGTTTRVRSRSRSRGRGRLAARSTASQ